MSYKLYFLYTFIRCIAYVFTAISYLDRDLKFVRRSRRLRVYVYYATRPSVPVADAFYKIARSVIHFETRIHDWIQARKDASR